MKQERRISRAIRVGGVQIGGGAPIPVQSMLNTPAHDFEAAAALTARLTDAGCDIVRLAVPDAETAEVFSYLRSCGVTIPLVADIHFDYTLALASVKAGASKIRINPGNIGAEWKVREVTEACKASGIPIRIGVNGGSLAADLRKTYGRPTPEALVESAFTQAEMLEKFGFSDIVLSLKTSSVQDSVEVYRLAAKGCSYPLHLGVTEAGDSYTGLIKNAAGVGALLADGIGDTLRVSLTADVVEEVRAGRELLRVFGLDTRGSVEVISCPTCGRTKIDLIGLAARFKDAVKDIDTKGKTVKVAVMGCVVNGPGEARDADFGIAGGDGFAVLFRHGETVCRVEEDQIVERLLSETYQFLDAEVKNT